MNITELNFKLSDAVNFHDELNPALWVDGVLDPEVKDQLILIAEDFISSLGIKDIDVKDITISGSNAAYSYTPFSDLDLHILVDMTRYPNNDVYKELFDAKKILYNISHPITIHDIPVELYVQDVNEPVKSLGEYSVLRNDWIKRPKKEKANLDQNATQAKYESLVSLIDMAIKTHNLDQIRDVMKMIKRYRQAGLDKAGEFGPENLAFKAVRNQGYIKKLRDARDKLHGQNLSIEEQLDEGASKKIITLNNLYHVGTLDASKKGTSSFEGAGLSVSTEPDAWIKIGKGHISGDTYKAIKTNNRFLNASSLTKSDLNKISEWAIEEKLVTRTRTIRVTYFDDELDSNVYQEFNSTEDAEKEFEDLSDYEVTTNDKGLGPTNKLKSLTKNSHITSTDVLDYTLPLYAENKGLDGVWWNDELDVSRYSAPRGVIVPSKISSWKFVKRENIKERTNLLDKPTPTVEQIAKKHNVPVIQVRNQLQIGIKVESEHTNKKDVALEIALDHLNEDPKYYDKLSKANLEEARSYFDIGIWWHGSPTNDYRGGVTGLHLGTKKAAEEALTARIGHPLEGYWDGTREYGKTKLCGQYTLRERGIHSTGYNCDAPIEDFFPTEMDERATVGNGVVVPFESKPSIKPFKIVGPMSNTPQNPYDDFKANGYMKASLKKGNAKRGFYYRNVGEDAGSISAVVPNANHIEPATTKVSEASGYIPSQKEKDDPRFKTALTIDVKPDAIKKNAKAFGFKTSRAGIPPQANPNGKV